jgi:hypothetical protein
LEMQLKGRGFKVLSVNWSRKLINHSNSHSSSSNCFGLCPKVYGCLVLVYKQRSSQYEQHIPKEELGISLILSDEFGSYIYSHREAEAGSRHAIGALHSQSSVCRACLTKY